MSDQQTMRADAMQLAGAKADLTPLLGTWLNCNAVTDHIAKIDVSERDGVMVIRPYGSSTADPVDWGEAEVIPYVAMGTTEPQGFHARFEIGAVHTEIAANAKQGIMVLQTYTSFHDGSGRMSHFGREFFNRADLGSGPRGRDKDGVRYLIGDWVNTYTDTQWIKTFSFTEDGGRYLLRVGAVNEPVDWGTAEATTYLDAGGKPCFHATYDLDRCRVVLASMTNKGLPVIEAFMSFPDGRTDHVREFYVRA